MKICECGKPKVRGYHRCFKEMNFDEFDKKIERIRCFIIRNNPSILAGANIYPQDFLCAYETYKLDNASSAHPYPIIGIDQTGAILTDLPKGRFETSGLECFLYETIENQGQGLINFFNFLITKGI